VGDEPEAVGTDGDLGVEEAVAADDAVVVDDDVWVHDGARADGRVAADGDAGVEDRVRADGRVFADDAQRADRGGGVDRCGLVDDRRGMDASRWGGGRSDLGELIEQRDQRPVGVVDQQQRAGGGVVPGDVEAAGDDRSGGFALCPAFGVDSRADKGDRARAGFVDAGEVGEFDVRRAEHFGAEHLGE